MLTADPPVAHIVSAVRDRDGGCCTEVIMDDGTPLEVIVRPGALGRLRPAAELTAPRPAPPF